MDKRKIFLAALAVILIAGFFLRLFPVRGGYHYWDETVYLQHAEILVEESPDNYNEFDFRPPLFSLILAGAFLINSSLLSAHLLVAGLSSLGIILVYIMGKELYSRPTALLASALYAASPLAIILSHDILVDPVLPVFWLGTAFSLVKALRTERNKWYVSTGLMAGLAVLMKFTSLVILPAITLIVLISHLRQNNLDPEGLVRSLKGFTISRTNWLMAAGFSATLLPYFIWSYVAFGSPLHVFLTAWTKSGARDAFMTYLGGWSLYILAPLYVGLFVFFWRNDLRKLENYLPLVFFLSLYLPLQLIIANKETRFLMPVLPFMVLMVSRGLIDLKEGRLVKNMKLSKAMFAFLIISSALILPTSMPERNVFAQGLSVEWQAPVMETGQWLKQNTEDDAIVYTNYQYPALGYYSKREIVWFREYVPLDQLIGVELDGPGYVYYSRDSSYPHPTLEELESDTRFRLNKTFENTIYLFYFTGHSR